MKTINILKTVFFAIVVLAFNTACVHDDDYKTPPIECTEFASAVSITEVKALYTGSVVQITNDIVLEGYVSSSDETGNIYKTIYIQDALENPTQGLTISVDAVDTYTKFPVGSKIFIKLKNLYLGSYGGIVQLGDMTTDENGVQSFGRITETKFNQTFFKGCGGIGTIVPKVLTIAELSSNADLVGALIKINDVEFVDGVLGTTYATSGATVNKNIEDCSGNTVILRNSGYSSFFGELLPSGKGAIVAIFSKYNNDNQLYIRDTNDTADMTGARCIIFSDNFGSTLNTSKWTAYSVLGTQAWNTSNQGQTSTTNGYYAVMNGFSGGAQNNEDWLISKQINLTGYNNVNLNFQSDVRYAGDILKVLVSEDYISGNPSTATWTEIPVTLDTNTGAFLPWVNSGNISLNTYLNKNIRIAFKYTSTTSAAATWEIDNVLVTNS